MLPAKPAATQAGASQATRRRRNGSADRTRSDTPVKVAPMATYPFRITNGREAPASAAATASPTPNRRPAKTPRTQAARACPGPESVIGQSNVLDAWSTGMATVTFQQVRFVKLSTSWISIRAP